MRRNAFSFTIPLLCALCAVTLIGAIGKADDQPPARAIDLQPLITLVPAVRDELLHDAPKSRAVVMEVTAYCPCPKCWGRGARGITASGLHVGANGGKFVAADTTILPFHTKLVIPGYAANKTVEVLDRGGAIKGRKLDVFFPTHQQALNWGRRKIEVIVTE